MTSNRPNTLFEGPRAYSRVRPLNLNAGFADRKSMTNGYAVAPRLQAFALGDRVVVSGRCAGWRNDATGVICSDPEPINTVPGEDYVYMVQFDAPQHDLSDNGPYFKAQILGSCIIAERNTTA